MKKIYVICILIFLIITNLSYSYEQDNNYYIDDLGLTNDNYKVNDGDNVFFPGDGTTRDFNLYYKCDINKNGIVSTDEYKECYIKQIGEWIYPILFLMVGIFIGIGFSKIRKNK